MLGLGACYDWTTAVTQLPPLCVNSTTDQTLTTTTLTTQVSPCGDMAGWFWLLAAAIGVVTAARNN